MLVVGCQVYWKAPPSDGTRTNLTLKDLVQKSLVDTSGTNLSGVGAFPSLVVTA